MNVGFNSRKARKIARELANWHQEPYRVFLVYMPSIYSVTRPPFFVERMPYWHQIRKMEWVKEERAKGNYVALPKPK